MSAVLGFAATAGDAAGRSAMTGVGALDRGGAAARGWASDAATGGRVEQRELQLQAEAARTQAGRVDGAQPVGGGDQRALVGGRGGQARQQPIADGVDDLVEEHAQVAAAVLELVEQGEAGRGVPGGEGRHEPVDGLRVGEAEQLADGLRLDATTRRGEQLVEDRFRVAHAAGREARHERDRIGIDLAARPPPGSSRACR